VGRPCAPQPRPGSNGRQEKEFETQIRKFEEGNGRGDFVELGRRFHFFIIEGSGNKVLIEILRTLYTKLDMIRIFSYGFRRKEAPDEHLEIIKALQNGDEARSYVCMQNHLENAFNTLTDLL
jgi:DNA-binding GntR family transcriptional regulator